MGAAAEVKIAFESATDVWTDLSDDVMISEGLAIHFGIAGDKPLDMVAGTGVCTFTLRGFKYSFHHADALSGWAFGARIRVTCYRAVDGAQTVTGITRSGSTATVTTAAGHGFLTGNWVTIAGASPGDYDGVFQITFTGATTFTYDLGSLTPVTASGTMTARVGYVRHNGLLRAANPTAGAYGTRYVAVVSYDGIRALAETKIREVAIQEDKTEEELLSSLLDSLPSDAQPLARDFDTGVDTYPYAFDGLGGGKTALSVVKDIAVSGFAMVYMQGDGTLCLRTRDTRASGASAFSFDDDMTNLVTNASVDELTNNVQCTIYPRTVDAAATTVIYSTTGVPLSVAAGDTLTLVVEYRSPTDDRELIGGTAVVTPLVATTDYLGNSALDGSGSDLTSDLAIVTTASASSAELAITNNGTATIYLVDSSGDAKLEIRGKGIYQESAQTFTSLSTQPYGDKTLIINLPYQNSPGNAQSYASTVQQQFNASAAAQMERIMFDGNSSDDLLQQALKREPNDIISITETATGASSIEMVIQSVSLDITTGPWIQATFGLAPSSPYSMWLLGTDGRTELGETTILGW